MSSPRIFILDTDVGYDPDDIMALQIIAMYVKNPTNNARLMVISSAERYEIEEESWFQNCFTYYNIKTNQSVDAGYGIQTLHRESIQKALKEDEERKSLLVGKRAKILYWLLKGLGFRVVPTISELQTNCEHVLVVSGLPGYVGDPAAAKTRQYSTFLKQKGSNYRQAVVPELLKLAIKDWDSLPEDKNNIVDLDNANNTMLLAFKDIDNPLSWIGIGSMCNVACLYWQAKHTAEDGDRTVLEKLNTMSIFQMAINVPFNKKFASTNTFLDPMSLCFINEVFEGEVHFIAAPLTSKYRWTSPMGYYDNQIRNFLEKKENGKQIFPKHYTALGHIRASSDTRDANIILEEVAQKSTPIEYSFKKLRNYVREKSDVYDELLSQTNKDTGKPKFQKPDIEASMIGALFTLTCRFLWQDQAVFKKAILANLYNKYGKVNGGEQFGKNTCSHFVIRDQSGSEKEFLMGVGVPKQEQENTKKLLEEFITDHDDLPNYLTKSLHFLVEMNLEDYLKDIEKDQRSLPIEKIKEQIVKLCSYIYPKPSEYWPFESSFHDPLTVLFAISHISNQKRTRDNENPELIQKLRILNRQLYGTERGICREVSLSLSEPYAILEEITLFQEDPIVKQEDVSLIYRNPEEFKSHDKKNIPVVEIKTPLDIPSRMDDVFLWNCKESVLDDQDKSKIPFKTTLDVKTKDVDSKKLLRYIPTQPLSTETGILMSDILVLLSFQNTSLGQPDLISTIVCRGIEKKYHKYKKKYIRYKKNNPILD